MPQVSREGCTSDEEAVPRGEVQEGLPAHALPILDHVRLVQDEVPPLPPLENLDILQTPFTVATHGGYVPLAEALLGANLPTVPPYHL